MKRNSLNNPLGHFLLLWTIFGLALGLHEDVTSNEDPSDSLQAGDVAAKRSFDRILRSAPVFSRILRNNVDDDEEEDEEGRVKRSVGETSSFSRILRSREPSSFSRILRSHEPSSFSRILRTSPSSFSRILRSSFSRILKRGGQNSFSRILRAPPSSFSRILRSGSHDNFEDDNDDDLNNNNYYYYDDSDYQKRFDRMMRDQHFSRILKRSSNDNDETKPNVDFSRILRAGSFSRILR